VHLGQGEREAGQRIAAETEQLSLHGLGIQVIKAAGQLYVGYFATGVLVQGVVLAEVIGLQQLVHGFATLAAEGLLLQQNRLPGAVVAAVGAGYVNGSFRNGSGHGIQGLMD
jgi:hypothetical protein